MDSTWALLLAYSFIFSDVEPPPNDLFVPVGAQEALKEVALKFDLIGDHDCHVTIWALRNSREITEGAPPSWAVRNLPGCDYLWAERNFALDHLDWVKGQRESSVGILHHFYQEWEAKAYELSEAYWYLANAKRMEDEPWNRSSMRYNLKCAAVLLGEDAIYTGCLPPPVPLQFFKRLR